MRKLKILALRTCTIFLFVWTICCYVVPVPVSAGGWFFSNAGVSYDCDTLRGDATLYWDGGHGDGTDRACKSGGIEQASDDTGAEVVDGSTIPSPQSGKWLKVDATNNSMTFGTDDEFTNGGEGRYEAKIIFDTVVGDTYFNLIEQIGAGTATVRVRLQGTGTDKLKIYAVGTSLESTVVLTDDTVYTVRAKWSDSTPLLAISVDGVWTSTTNDPGDTATAQVVIGALNSLGVGDTYWITDVKSWNTYTNESGVWKHD